MQRLLTNSIFNIKRVMQILIFLKLMRKNYNKLKIYLNNYILIRRNKSNKIF